MDAVGQSSASKEVGDDQVAAVRKLIGGQEMSSDEREKAQAALDLVRARDDGHPTDEELKAMQAGAGKHSTGMGLEDALTDIAEDASHLDYKAKAADGQPGQMAKVTAMLKDGQQVPIRVAGAGTSGHFMMLSDVRKGPGGNQYLVSDPLSGATRWVSQAELASGEFATKQFDVGESKVTHFYADGGQAI